MDFLNESFCLRQLTVTTNLLTVERRHLFVGLRHRMSKFCRAGTPTEVAFLTTSQAVLALSESISEQLLGPFIASLCWFDGQLGKCL